MKDAIACLTAMAASITWSALVSYDVGARPDEAVITFLVGYAMNVPIFVVVAVFMARLLGVRF